MLLLAPHERTRLGPTRLNIGTNANVGPNVGFANSSGAAGPSMQLVTTTTIARATGTKIRAARVSKYHMITYSGARTDGAARRSVRDSFRPAAGLKTWRKTMQGKVQLRPLIPICPLRRVAREKL
ncbi:MAG: hypothetical protein HN396_10620 [Gemmatimonadales bacterium]|nr:hypothetical protein [Gemmatimonadales bacterium]MBT3500232.1 hypothetical protein [Gemmatimonadales bacterium]MBT4188711.1 hypothetical protein [Gemmatimonadales bacterium]MBT4438336.1 hypothetical protein [Gemmatimonadales bacterium]MBT6695861.1 hypothetical protein [Gemmatimonadales bacterium]